MRRVALIVAALAALAAACSSGPRSRGARAPVEQRVMTAGAPVLELFPEGADLVVELDLGRLRDNDVVGGAVRALAPLVQASTAELVPGLDLVLDADVVVAAVYRLGREDSGLLVVARGAALDAAAAAAATPSGRAVDARTFAYGPAALVEAVAIGPGLLADPELVALRDEAMPLRAPGAALRAFARLDDEARIAVAERLGYDGAVPATLSVWADVADDFALTARLGADDAGEASRLAADVEGAARRAAAAAGRRLLVHKLKALPRGSDVIVVWTIGPQQLGKLVEVEEKEADEQQ